MGPVELRTMLYLARRGAGLSQREVARRAGVPQSTVARIERGDIDPRASTLNKLLHACDMELAITWASVDRNGVDRTLIRGQLARTATERLQDAEAWAKGATALREAMAQ